MSRRSARRGSGVGPIIGIIALVLALVTAGLIVRGNDRSGGFSAATADIAGFFGGIVAMPVRWVAGFFGSAGDFFGGATLNAKLKAENTALRAWRDEAAALRERLEAYEKLNNIAGEALPQGKTARMIGETSTVFSRTGIVNLGAKSGVAVNWIVVNQYGLVGRVIAVGGGSSRVLLLDDGASRVPVMGEATRVRAMMGGDSSPAPRLTHLNVPTLMRDGERVITSGDDGIFPRGIVVGQSGIAPDRQWRVRLASRSAAIDFVRLIPPSNFPTPKDQLSLPSLAAPPVGASAAISPIDGGTLGGVLPLAPGAAPVPSAATPQAIAQAQQAIALTKKLTAERDAAREAARRSEVARKAAEDRAERASKSASPSRRETPSAKPSTPKTNKLADPNSVPIAPSALPPSNPVPSAPQPSAPEGTR